jgi:catechol 2,3-dioxygenase-like lactoylglutathione lyase family enzyme
MKTKLPAPVPQVPVSNLGRSIEFYRSRLGFVLDWSHENVLAGISRDETRLFLAQTAPGEFQPVRIWLNLSGVSDVDALHREWGTAGVAIALAPERKEWGLYEFIAEDCDGNSYRVFYDRATPEQEASQLKGRESACDG